jgi:hypothetical protein
MGIMPPGMSLVAGTLDLRPRVDLEACLLLECARATADPLRLRALAAGPLRWARLLALAERHGLGPLVAWHLPRACADLVPDGTLARMRDALQKKTALAVLLTGELHRLLGGFDARGIDAIPFKGPALAARLYGHVARRPFGDLDILVREEDVWRASEVLEAAGFVADFEIPEARRAAVLRDEYVRLFRRAGGRLIVELHWAIARRSFAVRFDEATLWRRVRREVLQGRAVLAPSDEDLLLLLCVHGARHTWDRLEGVASVAELLRGSPALDWGHVWRQADSMRCRGMVTFALLLAHGVFGCPLAAEAAEAASPARIRMARTVVAEWLADEAPAPAFVRQAAFQLRLKDSYGDRARSCALVLLTPTPDDWDGVALPGPLALAYPLVRAFRVARKYGFAHHEPARGE